MKACLVLFSGGKDSLLSTILLIEQGYKVKLVHYDNMCSIGCSNVKKGYIRLVKKYGCDKVEYIGVKNISGSFRKFINIMYNMHISEIKEKYGNISISELNCLACRLSMYIASIIICQKMHIKYVADGARNSQLFAIEQDLLLERFKSFFEKYNIKIEFPLKDFKDDFELKNQLLIRGFVPKTIEPQCLLGMPISNKDLTNEIIESTAKILINYF